jgi:hypothetical protein
VLSFGVSLRLTRSLNVLCCLQLTCPRSQQPPNAAIPFNSRVRSPSDAIRWRCFVLEQRQLSEAQHPRLLLSAARKILAVEACNDQQQRLFAQRFSELLERSYAHKPLHLNWRF